MVIDDQVWRCLAGVDDEFAIFRQRKNFRTQHPNAKNTTGLWQAFGVTRNFHTLSHLRLRLLAVHKCGLDSRLVTIRI